MSSSDSSMQENPPIRILLVEDDAGDAQIVREILSKEKTPPFALDRVDRLQAGLDRLNRVKPDAILLDLDLPDSKGLDTFSQIYAVVSAIPIVVLSGLGDDSVALEAVRRGAQDYLTKGLDHTKMLPRVLRYAIERKRMYEQLRELTSEVQAIFQAFPDLYFRIDSNGTILHYNSQRAAEFLGQTEALGIQPNALAGKPMQDFFPQDVAGEFKKAMDKVRQGKPLVRFEYTVGASGSKRSFEARMTPLTDKELIAIIREGSGAGSRTAG